MGLDASQKKGFKALLDELRTDGWIRPSTQQVVDSKKVASVPSKQRPKKEIGIDEEKKNGSRKRKSKVQTQNPKGKAPLAIESEPKVVPKDIFPQALQAPASVAVGDTPVSTSQEVAVVASVPRKEQTRRKRSPDAPDVRVANTEVVALRRSAREPRQLAPYAESSDEDKPLKKMASNSRGMLPSVPPGEYELARIKTIVETARIFPGLVALPKNVASEIGDDMVISAVDKAISADDDNSEYVPSEESVCSTSSDEDTGTAGDGLRSKQPSKKKISKKSPDVLLEIPDVMRGSDRCVFSPCKPLTPAQPDSTTVERS